MDVFDQEAHRKGRGFETCFNTTPGASGSHRIQSDLESSVLRAGQAHFLCVRDREHGWETVGVGMGLWVMDSRTGCTGYIRAGYDSDDNGTMGYECTSTNSMNETSI